MSTELFRRAAAGDFAPEVLHYFSTSAQRHRDGADLDRAFRLDRASRLRERNQALKDAAALLAADDGPWHCAARLAMALRRYDIRIAPLVAREPGMTLPPIDRALQRAFESGMRVPTTQRNLFELIR